MGLLSARGFRGIAIGALQGVEEKLKDKVRENKNGH